MINMVLARATIEKRKNDTGQSETQMVASKVVFSVPLLALVPINNLVVDKVTVDFDLEITSTSQKEQSTSGLADNAPINQKKAYLHGRIAERPPDGKSADGRVTPRLKVNINASPLPLPLGVLSILQLYSKSIQPQPDEKPQET